MLYDRYMIQNTPNDLTLDAYDTHVDAYLKTTPHTLNSPHEPLVRWIDEALREIKPTGTILEIGSATSRDAEYIRNKGFTI